MYCYTKLANRQTSWIISQFNCFVRLLSTFNFKTGAINTSLIINLDQKKSQAAWICQYNFDPCWQTSSSGLPVCKTNPLGHSSALAKSLAKSSSPCSCLVNIASWIKLSSQQQSHSELNFILQNLALRRWVHPLASSIRLKSWKKFVKMCLHFNYPSIWRIFRQKILRNLIFEIFTKDS